MSTEQETDPSLPWKVGFAETSGIRNKLCIATLRILKFESESESLFGMFDGGHNNEAPKLLLDLVPSVLRDELRKQRASAATSARDAEHDDKYMKYTMLTAHRKLRATGQKLGACAALCHIRCVRSPEAVAGSSVSCMRESTSSLTSSTSAETHALNRHVLRVGNVGDVEVVLCRRGEAVCVTRKFTTSDNDDERDRVYRCDGIITEVTLTPSPPITTLQFEPQTCDVFPTGQQSERRHEDDAVSWQLLPLSLRHS